MRSLYFVCAVVAVAWADADIVDNPLFEDLASKGIAATSRDTIRLPRPSMADGLKADAQNAAIAAIAGQDYPIEELARKSVVAPHILKIRDIPTSNPDTPAHGIDLWFIAYGDPQTVANKQFLEQWRDEQRDHKIVTLAAAELVKRGIKELRSSQLQDRYAHVEFPLLERVRVKATLHTILTSGKESVVVALKMDPAFAGDADFPNQWRSMSRDDDGRLQLGAAEPYAGAGAYVKITRLHQPVGAAFIEYHLVFAEPKGWFGGANLLRSKVPILVQSEVRSFRRQLAKFK